jgi:hypothetical protein
MLIIADSSERPITIEDGPSEGSTKVGRKSFRCQGYRIMSVYKFQTLLFRPVSVHYSAPFAAQRTSRVFSNCPKIARSRDAEIVAEGLSPHGQMWPPRDSHLK